MAAVCLACFACWPVRAPCIEEDANATKAAEIELTWWLVGGSGAAVSGGPYDLDAVIGQSSPGSVVGGNYVLESGFLAGSPSLDEPIFSDGFETGSTSQWSAAVGN